MRSDLERKLNRFLFFIAGSARRRLWVKLSKLLSNGVPLLDAMRAIHDRRVESGLAKDAITIGLAEWIDGLRNGLRLSEVTMGWIPREERMLIAAGETSGRLDSALMDVSEIMQAKSRIRGAVLKGLTYPAIMMIIAFGVLIMFSYRIVPEFSRIVGEDRWQGIAGIMVAVANFSRDWMPVIVGLVAVSIFGLFFSMPNWSGGLRIRLDRYVPYSIYRIVHGSTMMISLAALVTAGVRIETALQQLGEGASKWMSDRIQACLRGMRSGLNLGEAMAKSGYGFPDPEIIEDLAVYSRLSGFDQALSSIGREWIGQSVERIREAMQVVFGISLLLVGFFIAFMFGGLISMEMQMNNIIQGSYR